MTEIYITIDGEKQEIENYDVDGNGMVYITTDQSVRCIIAASHEIAGAAAREYWADMAENDPEELCCMIGGDTLIQWALGNYAGPGNTQVQSLTEWLDLWLDTPEEHFATFDGEENEAELDVAAQIELDLPQNVVLYYA